jgi:hypothetical protein
LRFKFKYLLFFFLLSACASDTPEVYTVCFTGDVLLDRGVAKIIKQKGDAYIAESMSDIFSVFDYKFVNLECPITTRLNALPKLYSFRAEPEFGMLLQQCGVTHASLANNHANDQQELGLNDTYRFLKSIGVKPTGYGNDTIAACAPVEIADRKIAVFSFVDLPLSDAETVQLCRYERSGLVAKIWEYKNNHPTTKIICYVHWGIEYSRYPSIDQLNVAKLIIDAGADAVVGHHPHVIQKIQFYKNKPIFFSLGNFVFDQMMPMAKRALVAGFSLAGDSLQTFAIPVLLDNTRPLRLQSDSQKDAIADLRQLSHNVEFRKTDLAWSVHETRLNDVSVESVADTKHEFRSIEVGSSTVEVQARLRELTHLKGYRLSLLKDGQMADELHLPYDVYRFEAADVNSDGRTDILVGVIKSTHFDREVSKRLFALEVDEGHIRPLWLGSRVCQKLVDFKPIVRNGVVLIYTIEDAGNRTFSNGLYEWNDFGLRLFTYEKKNVSYLEALKRFENAY